ncbi:MAG: hypothetical protein KC457_34135, partial [Myxococcales bacterium]|nr:hypothetical protein [Myxococcales bacterium]
GALVTQTEKASCGPWSAGRFITLADDLATAFPCAAEVGISGDIEERQIEALLRAAGPEYAGVGGCNEGFIRDDALLVVVVITDEDDGSIVPGEESSVGDPPQWFDELVAIKGGIESNAVVLALIGRPLPNDCNPNDTFTAKVGHRIKAFVDLFSYGRIGDVCAGDYAPFFNESLALISEACEGFVPFE